MADKIKRWGHIYHPDGSVSMEHGGNGAYVRFDDHIDEVRSLRQQLDLSQSSFNSALKAMNRNDERRGREYARFLASGAGDGQASEIAIARIFEIVNRAYSGTLCNFASATDSNGVTVAIPDVIIECQSAAENNLLDVTGVDMNRGEP